MYNYINYIKSKGHTHMVGITLHFVITCALEHSVSCCVCTHCCNAPHSFLTLCLGILCSKSETSHRGFRQLYLSSQWCHQPWLETRSLVYLIEPFTRYVLTHSDWIRPAGGLWPGREDVLKSLLTTYSFVLLHPTFFFMLKFFMFKSIIISEQVKVVLVRYF